MAMLDRTRGPSSFPVDRSDLEHLESARPRDWRNPEPAPCYNLVVIGGGPAGLVAARGAVAFGARVALIEDDMIGGDCLNVGCVPSKTIIRTSRLYADMDNAEHFGARLDGEVDIDFPLVMDRMRRIRQRISRGDSVRRLAEEGIDVFFGQGRFIGPDTIEVAEARLRFRKAIVATGSCPLRPDIPGLAEAGYLTNENAFNLTRRPSRLLVIGGGPLGCETAQAFARLGVKVTIAQNEPKFLPWEERDAAQIVSDALARDGVEVRLNTGVVAVRTEGGEKIADLVNADWKSTVAVDEIIVGVGRSPNVEGIGLEAAGIEYDPVKGIKVDDFLRTTNRRVYAAGDVCLKYKFTHMADASARIAVRNALFLGRARMSRLTIPWCTYTDPEIAHVGMYVIDARERGIPVRTFTILMHDVDRAVTDGEDEGFVKIHVKEGTDRILGATIVARHAGEMINGISLAIGSGMGLRALANVIHTYPTQAEAIKMAADAYNRTRLTPLVKAITTRWFSWMR
jgi:pyruvate/2-oxoglutarate dehydrogenase complex dihydrolipoamide dehydrogenase (E3) component